MKHHFQIVHVEKKYECCYCLAIFPSKQDTDKHISCYHEIENQNSLLMFHGQVHESNKKLLYETENENNLVIYEKKNELQCSICNKVFGRKSDLKRHFSTVHEGKRPFECSFCPAKFCKRMDMNNHIIVVHEERTFFPHRLVQFHFIFSSFLFLVFAYSWTSLYKEVHGLFRKRGDVFEFKGNFDYEFLFFTQCKRS